MFYIILAAVVFVALVLIFRDDHDRRYDQRGGSEGRYLAEKPTPRPAATTPRPAPRTNARKSMEAEVAGLRYYCSLVDIGPISGVVRAEPDNAHDPRAQAVVRADGKLIGYIPRAALDEFEAFNPKNLPCPFTGRITVDASNHLYGTLHITEPGF